MNIKIAIVIFLVLESAGFGGCATLETYAADRGRDFLDMFTLNAGYGYGASARVRISNLISTGFGYSKLDKAGMRGRNFGKWSETYIGFGIMDNFEQNGMPARLQHPNPRTFETGLIIPFCSPASIGDSWHEYDELGWGDVEISATLGFAGLTAGINVIEVFDFALSVFLLDILGDDEIPSPFFTITRETAP